MIQRLFSATLLTLLFSACGAMVGALAGSIAPEEGPLSPEDPEYQYRDGAIYEGDALLYKVVDKYPDRYTSHFTLTDTDGRIQLTLSCMDMGSTHQCRADFPTIDRYYEVKYPEVPITRVFASFFREGVLARGQVMLEGLEGYAAKRQFSLVVTSESHKRMDIAAKRAKCQQCDEDFRLCQVDAADRRRNPRPGVTFSASCSSQFRLCSFGGSRFEATRERNRDKWPCGTTPR